MRIPCCRGLSTAIECAPAPPALAARGTAIHKRRRTGRQGKQKMLKRGKGSRDLVETKDLPPKNEPKSNPERTDIEPTRKFALPQRPAGDIAWTIGPAQNKSERSATKAGLYV
jgi:hypothetical protein